MGISVIALLASLSVAGLLSLWLASNFSPLHLWDAPNERSLHTRSTPCTGGLAILAGITVGWLLVQPSISGFDWIVVAALLVTCVSFIDDLKGLSPLTRLCVHFCAGALLVMGDVMPGTNGMGSILVVLGIVWMVNLYNFMDGMDGLAGGMAMFGFGFMGAGGILGGDIDYAITCWVVAAASAGFLILNIQPSRLFMGDTGSAMLGLLAGALALAGVINNLFPLWYPILIFSPFIVDATVTLVRRIIQGEKVWQAHCSHYYQRLVKLGWGQRRTALAEYALILTCGVSALALLHLDTKIVAFGLVVWVLVYIGIVIAIRHLEGIHMQVHTESKRQ